MEPNPPPTEPLIAESLRGDAAPRMQYRNRPVSVAVDPVSLVISECISITSAIQKHARSPHSSVSAILGGNPNSINLGTTSATSNPKGKTQLNVPGRDGELNINTRWGLRGQKGKSMQDNPMIAGFGTLRNELAGVKSMLENAVLSFMLPPAELTSESRYSNF